MKKRQEIKVKVTAYMASLLNAIVPLGKSLSRTLTRALLASVMIRAWLPLTIPVRST